MKDLIAEHGVVGAGGAGFPTAVKLTARAEMLIVNAAECEPLLHKDKELLVHHWPEVRRGLEIALQRVGASRAVIGIKEKHEKLIRRLQKALPPDTSLHSLADAYPSGDEFILVYDITGRVIPPGGLPIHLGIVVCNVETLFNIGCERPVTHKFLTVAGAVRRPSTLRVPIGTPLADVIEAAGGSVVPEFRVLVGGAMMGRLAGGLDEPVTKTTGGLIVLPASHPLIARYSLGWRQVGRKAKSACDQCSFCTELCPRYLLGHPIEPHKAMRSVAFGRHNPEIGLPVYSAPASEGLYCCGCNLCSLFSCPEDLDPKEVCLFNKSNAKREARDTGNREYRPHPLINARRVPTARLSRKLGLSSFVDEGALSDKELRPARVVLPLVQHIGRPCTPLVKVN
ncbi:MAG TPA: SLBB domain-containing protein, partial [Acidobacteriota bacterium]|nr:SLBB domain-containing protein [Acidobacteriota bacterium]